MALISELPDILRGWCFENQRDQGNMTPFQGKVAHDRGEGNFSWNRTPQGTTFWNAVDDMCWVGGDKGTMLQILSERFPEVMTKLTKEPHYSGYLHSGISKKSEPTLDDDYDDDKKPVIVLQKSKFITINQSE